MLVWWVHLHLSAWGIARTHTYPHAQWRSPKVLNGHGHWKSKWKTRMKTCSSLSAYNQLAAGRQVSALESCNLGVQSPSHWVIHFPSTGCKRFIKNYIRWYSYVITWYHLPLIFPLLSERKNSYLMAIGFPLLSTAEVEYLHFNIFSITDLPVLP